jgi:SPP1 family predicted phage head-tail adaptor
MGGSAQVWSTQDTISGTLWPTSAKEQKQAASPTMSITHQIRIRYYEGIKGSWRIKKGTRYFSIVSIVDFEERHIYMDLLCREVLT